MTYDEEKSLDLLKEIFLSENNRKIEEFEDEIERLKRQLNDKEAQISNYYPIINELLERKINDSKDEIAQILSPVMGLAIKKQVTESKNDIIDALYPVIGETIRKSVSENLKEFYTTINNKIENALKRSLLKKRIQSKISGVNTSEIILKDSFPCYIKEVFLIHEDSGIMISHLSASEEDMSGDADLISGMLTAIKDFVAESFKSGEKREQLYEIQYGDSKIILERGRYSYFAVVISGMENAIFHEELDSLNSYLHKNYHKQLRAFEGDVTQFSKLDNRIKEFIGNINIRYEESSEDKPSPFLTYILGGILLLVLILFGVPKIIDMISNSKVDSEINQRLQNLKRFSNEEINWTVNDSILTLKGKVQSIGLYNSIDSTFTGIKGIKRVDNFINVAVSQINTDSLENYLVSILNSKDFNGNSNIKYQIVENNLFLSGDVSTDNEKILIGHKLSQFPGVFGIINNLEVSGEMLLSDDQYISIIKNTELLFDIGVSKINPKHIAQIDKFLPFLVGNDKVRLTIFGYSDNRGSSEMKQLISKERSESVARYLLARGVKKENFHTVNNYESLDPGQAGDQNQMRRVDFQIKIAR